MKLTRGHQALLPKNTAYRFRSREPGVVVLQTCKGDLSVERWAEICQTPEHPSNGAEHMSTTTPEARQGRPQQTPDATLGYNPSQLGGFRFRRDEYFVPHHWTARDGRPMSHTQDAATSCAR
jgi:hypothetical protein